MTCDLCAHARDHGSWPPGFAGTHCDHCHRSWTSHAQSHCVAIQPDGSSCCRHFGSNAAGDAHRIKGVCADPKGIDQWHTPAGIIIGGKHPEAGKAHAARARATRWGSAASPEATESVPHEVTTI